MGPEPRYVRGAYRRERFPPSGARGYPICGQSCAARGDVDSKAGLAGTAAHRMADSIHAYHLIGLQRTVIGQVPVCDQMLRLVPLVRLPKALE